jgi:hypothetical protein
MAVAQAPPRNLLVGLAGGICIASRARAVTAETRRAARAALGRSVLAGAVVVTQGMVVEIDFP